MDIAIENKQTAIVKYLEGQVNLEPIHLIYTLENSVRLYAGSFDACTKEILVKFDISVVVVVNDTNKVCIDFGASSFFFLI
jgi:hypothetical protein